jgi:hypothetical protein
LNFEWDELKAEFNWKKHHVSFLEAVGVFSDGLASTVQDPDHSASEYRFLTFGRTLDSRYVVVSYTERNGIIRMISARRMTPRERKAYEE